MLDTLPYDCIFNQFVCDIFVFKYFCFLLHFHEYCIYVHILTLMRELLPTSLISLTFILMLTFVLYTCHAEISKSTFTSKVFYQRLLSKLTIIYLHLILQNTLKKIFHKIILISDFFFI